MKEIDRDLRADFTRLADAFFQNLEREQRCEYGGWGLDDKRPFGNSDVEGDILEILGIPGSQRSEELDEYASELYAGLGDWLCAEWQRLRSLEANRG